MKDKFTLKCLRNRTRGLIFLLIAFAISSNIVVAQGPAKLGTTNLTAWFKPDSLPSGDVLSFPSSYPNGASTLTFTDTTGAPYPQATDTSNGVLNYNKVISFAGNSAANVLTLGKLGAVNLLNNNTSTGASTVVMVYYLPSYTATGGHFIHYRESGGDGIQYRHLGTVSRCAIGTSNSANGTRDYTEDYKPMLFSYTGNKSGASTMTAYKRAKSFTSTVSSASTGDNGVIIGARLNASNWAGFYEGYVGELMFYNTTLSPANLNKVHSYLALKYGITLDNTGGGAQGDYTAPNGALLWDASDNPSYHNHIIGIGREDGEGYDHRQSHTIDDSVRLYVGTLASTNLSNYTPIYNDSSYIVMGSNLGQLAGNASSNSEKPSSGVVTRIEREWKIKNTNFIDYFSIDIKLDSSAGLFNINSSDLVLLVDNDGDFSDATVLDYTSGIGFSYSSGVVTISNLGYTQFPLDSTRYFTLGSKSANTPLPVNFVSFNASRNEDMVKVDWATSTETNSDYFTIERATNSNNWEDIGKVKAAGNSGRLVNYSFIDNNPPRTLVYYRLRQTDLDGKFTHTQKVAVNMLEPREDILVVYPSISSGEIHVNIPLPNAGDYQFINALGQELTMQIKVVSSKEHETTFDISGLAPGTYYFVNGTRKAFFIKK